MFQLTIINFAMFFFFFYFQGISLLLIAMQCSSILTAPAKAMENINGSQDDEKNPQSDEIVPSNVYPMILLK